MRKFISLLGAVTLALGILAVAPTPADGSCTQGKIVLYEHSAGNGSYKTFCSPTNVNNLANVSGPCLTSWNDCASSVTTSGTVDVCIWTNSGYDGDVLKFVSPVYAYTLSGTYNDKVSSIKWGSSCHL